MSSWRSLVLCQVSRHCWGSKQNKGHDWTWTNSPYFRLLYVISPLALRLFFSAFSIRCFPRRYVPLSSPGLSPICIPRIVYNHFFFWFGLYYCLFLSINFDDDSTLLIWYSSVIFRSFPPILLRAFYHCVWIDPVGHFLNSLHIYIVRHTISDSYVLSFPIFASFDLLASFSCAMFCAFLVGVRSACICLDNCTGCRFGHLWHLVLKAPLALHLLLSFSGTYGRGVGTIQALAPTS